MLAPPHPERHRRRTSRTGTLSFNPRPGISSGQKNSHNPQAAALTRAMDLEAVAATDRVDAVSVHVTTLACMTWRCQRKARVAWLCQCSPLDAEPWRMGQQGDWLLLVGAPSASFARSATGAVSGAVGADKSGERRLV
jgi:hypothetical protein